MEARRRWSYSKLGKHAGLKKNKIVTQYIQNFVYLVLIITKPSFSFEAETKVT